jgi:hypothetical protein
VEEAREKSHYQVAHAADDKDKIVKCALEGAHGRALKEAEEIQQATRAKIALLQEQHVRERAVLRSDLEKSIDPAVEKVIALVTGVALGSDA